MKKNKLLFCFITVLFFCFTTNVEALECKYKGYTIPEIGASGVVTISDDFSSAKAIIDSVDNKAMNNKEGIENWDDIKNWISENKTCPNFAVISYYKFSPNGARFYLASGKKDAEAIQKEVWDDYKGLVGRNVVAYYENFNPSQEDQDFYYSQLESMLDDFEIIMSDHANLESCKKNYKDKKGSEIYSTCKEAIQVSYDGTLSYAKKMIELNQISAIDPRTVAFMNTYNSYKEEYDEFIKEVDQAIKSPGDVPIFPEEDVDVDINLGTICEDARVSRTLQFFGILLFIAKLFVPAIIIIMGSIDFAKAMIAGKTDELPKKIPVFAKRLVIGFIIFFIPSFIELMFSVIDTYNDTIKKYQNCHTCILNPNDCIIGDNK